MKSNRVEKQIIKRNSPIYSIVDHYCFCSKNLYNETNYIIRQSYIKEGIVPTAFDLQKIMKTMDCYKQCGASAAQKTIQLVSNNWKSFFKALKDYKNNPKKYLGRPKLPRYLDKDGRQIFMLKNIQCSLKDGNFRISFKPFNGYTVKTHAEGKLMQCRFIPKDGYYIMEIVYEIDVPDVENNSERIAAIDLGIDNLLTITTNCGIEPIVINGKPLKSINQYYNKVISNMRSDLKKRHNKDWSKEMQRFTTKRNRKIEDYIHKTTRYVVDWCVENNIDTLICGYNKCWKQETDMNKQSNQKFAGIPYYILTQQLAYKCENEGIIYKQTEESYTSGTSFLDGEEPVKKNYNKERRIYRGLFKSNGGVEINADVNGSYQIMKKVFPNALDEWDRGCGLHPIVVNLPL